MQNRIQVDTDRVAALFESWLKKPVFVAECNHGIKISTENVFTIATWKEIERAQYTGYDFEQLMKRKKMQLVFQLRRKNNG